MAWFTTSTLSWRTTIKNKLSSFCNTLATKLILSNPRNSYLDQNVLAYVNMPRYEETHSKISRFLNYRGVSLPKQIIKRWQRLYPTLFELALFKHRKYKEHACDFPTSCPLLSANRPGWKIRINHRSGQRSDIFTGQVTIRNNHRLGPPGKFQFTTACQRENERPQSKLFA